MEEIVILSAATSAEVTESFALTKNLLPLVEVVREVSGIGQASSTVKPV